MNLIKFMFWILFLFLLISGWLYLFDLYERYESTRKEESKPLSFYSLNVNGKDTTIYQESGDYLFNLEVKKCIPLSWNKDNCRWERQIVGVKVGEENGGAFKRLLVKEI